jgi:hypothetical protein
LALRLASNSLLAILLQQFFALQKPFPLSNSFLFQKPPTSKRLPHQKANNKKSQTKGKSFKTKASFPPSGSLLYPMVNRAEQQFWGQA